MRKSIGMIEFNSIARGIETCDFMVKVAPVDLLRSCTICPGKYMVIVSGDVADVKSSMAEGKAHGAETIVDTLLIPNIHEQLIPAISQTNQITEYGAVGVMEFYSVASAIFAADVAAKAAEVNLIEVRTGFAIGGKGFVTLTGDVAAVKSAVKAATQNVELLVETTVIPRPAPELFKSLM